MAAPTNAAFVKKSLANSEPSTHGPSRQAVLRLVSVAFGCIADMVGPAAGFVSVENDPSRPWKYALHQPAITYCVGDFIGPVVVAGGWTGCCWMKHCRMRAQRWVPVKCDRSARAGCMNWQI